jgi:phospholipase/carboxylesterase
MDNDHVNLSVAGGLFRVRPPLTQPGGPLAPPRLILLLHGWTGDENSMWVFESALPRGAWLAAPRAPYPSPLGGSTWLEGDPDRWPPLSGWVAACDDLLERLDAVGEELSAPVRSFDVLGFSQGGAAAYTLALLYPDRVRQAGVLAGFMPEPDLPLAARIPALRPGGLTGKRFFVAHGMRDERVPVAKARRAVELLESCGALVSYCEADTGHKLSAGCFHSLRGFFNSPPDHLPG